MTERGDDCPLVKSSDSGVHTKASRRDEKDSNLQGEALVLGAMMGWDVEQKVSLIVALFDSHLCWPVKSISSEQKWEMGVS